MARARRTRAASVLVVSAGTCRPTATPYGRQRDAARGAGAFARGGCAGRREAAQRHHGDDQRRSDPRYRARPLDSAARCEFDFAHRTGPSARSSDPGPASGRFGSRAALMNARPNDPCAAPVRSRRGLPPGSSRPSPRHAPRTAQRLFDLARTGRGPMFGSSRRRRASTQLRALSSARLLARVMADKTSAVRRPVRGAVGTFAAASRKVFEP